jgi:hypothetical protein
MARSAHAYVRGSTTSFYHWLEADRIDPESEAMAAPTDPQVVAAAIDARGRGKR